MMTNDILKWLAERFPNLLGLLILAGVLWLINSQTQARLDNHFELLVSCLKATGQLP